MKVKDSITLNLKKEEEIKASFDSFNDKFQISEANSLYQINPSKLESLVSKYTDSDNNNELLKYIESLGGTENILEHLKTTKEGGIQNEQFRKKIYGINKVFEEPMKPFIKFLKESLSELMIIILLSSAALEVIIGVTISEEKKYGWIDGTSVFCAVFTVVFVESFTN